MPSGLDISITLFTPDGSAAPNPKAVQKDVSKGLAAIWPSLGLPTEPVVTVVASDQPFDLFAFSITVAGAPMPVPVTYPLHPDAPIHFRILSTIFANRTQLITDAQLRKLRQDCIAASSEPAAWRGAPLSVWRSMASLLLKNGFSLFRLAYCFKSWLPGQPIELAFEEHFKQLSSLRLQLEVSPELAAVDPANGETTWEDWLPEFYQDVYKDLGIILPQVQLVSIEGLPFEQFNLQINDLQVPVLPGLSAGQQLFNKAGDTKVYHPAHRTYYTASAENNNAESPVVASPQAYLRDWLRHAVGQYASWFINAGIVDAQMDNLEETNRSLIVMIREKWPTYRLCSVLRLLLEEGVGVRNLPEILDVLLRIDGPLLVDDTHYLPYFPPVNRVVVVSPGADRNEPLSDWQLVGQVRASLKFPVTYPHLSAGVLPCYNFDPVLLRDFREGFYSAGGTASDEGFAALLRKIYQVTRADHGKPVFLTPTGIRPTVLKALRPYFPNIVVLGHEELPPIFVPQVKASINLP